MIQFNPEHFYRRQITSLEKMFQQNQSDQAIWKKFIEELAKQSKIEITFDSRFSDIFKDHFRAVQENYSGSQNFIAKVKWVEKLNQLSHRNNFISKRDYRKINEQLQGIKDCPSTNWLEYLPYIKNATSLNEFRGDFLTRFCKYEDEEAQNLVEEIESDSVEALYRLKREYVDFFKKFLQPNIMIKVASFVESEWSKRENKVEMLPRDLILDLQKKLRSIEVGSDTNEVIINKTLKEIAQENLYQNDREVQQRLNYEVQLIQKALDKFSGLNIIKDKELKLHLGKFGSLTSGFASADADLDLTIMTNSYVKEDEFLKLLFQFLKKEYMEGDKHSQGRRVKPELILQAKTPLIAITISERNKSDIKIDVILNNILGVINSRFLRVYSSVVWVKNLGILVKLWGKSIGLIDKKNLSSYSLILMLIHYLIRSKVVKPILDARSRTSSSPHFRFKRLKQNQIEQFDVYYSFKTRPEDVSSQQRVNYYRILEGFFRYYAKDIWNQKSEQARIITVDQSGVKQIDKETVITIKDPFDQPHNPGRLKIQSKDFFIQKFKEAVEVLTDTKESTKLTEDVRKDKITNLFSARY